MLWGIPQMAKSFTLQAIVRAEKLNDYNKKAIRTEMRRIFQITIIFLFNLSCRTSDNNSGNEFTYHYEVDSYYNNSNEPKNFISTKYYDSSDKLIRETKRDGICIEYLYNENDKIAETVTGRNCDFGRRSIFIYDSAGNHLGNFETLQPNIDLDTVDFEQTKFYNDLNQLVKEKISETKSIDGELIEIWNLYKYDKDLKTSLEVKKNDFTEWYGTYKYDSVGNILELKKTRNERYETETFTYNNLGLLIEIEKKNNGKLITPMGTFDHPDRRIVFKYDSTNFLYEESIYDNDKFTVKTINEKSIFKNENTP